MGMCALECGDGVCVIKCDHSCVTRMCVISACVLLTYFFKLFKAQWVVVVKKLELLSQYSQQ